jgi:hypothetical protein
MPTQVTKQASVTQTQFQQSLSSFERVQGMRSAAPAVCEKPPLRTDNVQLSRRHCAFDKHLRKQTAHNVLTLLHKRVHSPCLVPAVPCESLPAPCSSSQTHGQTSSGAARAAQLAAGTCSTTSH